MIVVLCLLRMLKYFRIFPGTGPVVQAIMSTLASPAVLILFFLWLSVIFCFAMAFHLSFGTDIDRFQEIGASFASLIRAIFGDFDYDSLQQSSFVLGPFLFLWFFSFVALIIQNLFVAVIFDCYNEQRQEHEKSWERFVTLLMIENCSGEGRRFTVTTVFLAIRRLVATYVSKPQLATQVLELENLGRKSVDPTTEPKEPKEGHNEGDEETKSEIGEAAQTNEPAITKRKIVYMREAETDKLAEEARNDRETKTNLQIYNMISQMEQKFAAEISTVKSQHDEVKEKLNQLLFIMGTKAKEHKKEEQTDPVPETPPPQPKQRPTKTTTPAPTKTATPAPTKTATPAPPTKTATPPPPTQPPPQP